MTHNL
jgi:hypothetical protein